jgi:NADH-quinone oxidoreductase subunit N
VSTADLVAYIPVVIIAAASLVVLVAVAAFRNRTVAFLLGIAGLAASLVSLPFAWAQAPRQITALLTVDGFGLFAVGLIAGATLLVALLAFSHGRAKTDERGEFPFLLLLAALGACVLATASNFATLFLGLELMGVSLYGLIAFPRERLESTEAGIKYLVLAGASSAFLLFGMALVYADTGVMDLASVGAAAGKPGFLVPAGLALMVVGLGFKLAVVPFHLWTPDVYDGAPAPVTAFIASVSKGATAVVLARILVPALAVTGLSGPLFWTFAVIAGLSMFVGNLLALREDNVKRLLAYSSIAHLGYLLIAFLARGPEALRAVSFYLAAYFLTTIGAFGVVGAVSSPERDAAKIREYEGLAARRPWLAAAFLACLLSLAGLPLTAGFVGKFIIVTAGAGAAQWVLVVLLAVNSTLSVFYYLKVVSAMFRQPGAEVAAGGGPAAAAGATTAANAAPVVAGISVALAALGTVALGVYPAPLLRIIALFAGG